MKDLKDAIEKGTKAWADVPDASAWVEELRGNVDKVNMSEEREKVAQWMMDKGYATGHGDTVEDMLNELEWQVAERERNACAKVILKRKNHD